MDDENGKGRLGREWASVKKDLAKGLPSLDNVGLTYQEPQWQEDEYIMNKGMRVFRQHSNWRVISINS